MQGSSFKILYIHKQIYLCLHLHSLTLFLHFIYKPQLENRVKLPVSHHLSIVTFLCPYNTAPSLFSPIESMKSTLCILHSSVTKMKKNIGYQGNTQSLKDKFCTAIPVSQTRLLMHCSYLQLHSKWALTVCVIRNYHRCKGRQQAIHTVLAITDCPTRSSPDIGFCLTART